MQSESQNVGFRVSWSGHAQPHECGSAYGQRSSEGEIDRKLLLRKDLTKLRFKFSYGSRYFGKRVIKSPKLYFLDSALAAELT